jgi:hypothetical protein
MADPQRAALRFLTNPSELHIATMPIDELVGLAETLDWQLRATPRPSEVPDATDADCARFTELFCASREASLAVSARVDQLCTELVPRLYRALEAGDPAELAAAVEAYRALPSVARRWIFEAYAREVFSWDADPFHDVEPLAFSDAAVARRRALAEADETDLALEPLTPLTRKSQRSKKRSFFSW